MKINQFFEVIVTSKTAVSSYSNGANECCVLIEDNQSFALSFSSDCLENLTDFIAQLQQIKTNLVESKKAELKKETQLLSGYTTTQVLLPEFARTIDFWQQAKTTKT